MLKKLLIALQCFLVLCTVSVTAQIPYEIISVETYAGSSSGSTNGTRLNARFNEPIDMVFDAAGNLYIAEESGSTIRIMDPSGNVSSFVGSSGNTGLVDGTGSTARFFDIRGITLDNNGNLIVADKENHAIRRVTPAGVVTTIAGGTVGFMDGDVSVAMFNKPTSVLVDSDGNIFVGDAANNRIRKIDTSGNVTTVIGTGTAGYQDGNLNSATIDNPTGMAFIDPDRMIISTRLGVRQLDLKKVELTTLVGGNGATPFADGDKNSAGFSALQAVYIDEQSSIFVVDRHALRYISPDGTVTTLAGSGTQGTSNGSPLSSGFFFPRGLVQTPDGDFLIADKASHRIRRILTQPGPSVTITSSETEPSSNSSFEVTFTLSETSNDFTADDVTISNGSISNFTGDGISYTANISPAAAGKVTVDVSNGVFTNSSGTGNQAAPQFSINSLTGIPAIISVETYAGSSSGVNNGNRLDARFNEPIDMVFDDSGNLYIAEEGGSSIRIMNTDGIVSEFVGSSGNTGLVDGTGTAARFNQIRDIAIDQDGNLIVADKDNHAVRKVTPSGEVTTIAGGLAGFLDGDKSVAMFNKPTAIISDSFGNIFVGDGLNNKIRKIAPDGNVTTLIGTGSYSDIDGDITTAAIRSVGSLAFDLNDDLIITSALGIRKYDFETGILSTIVGGDTSSPFADGYKDNVGFNAIQAIYIDAPNTMYIVDRHALRHVAADGTVTTLAGNSTQGTSNGDPLSSRFFFPRGIVKDAGGDFLIADKASHKIRRIFTNLKPTVSVTTNEASPSNATSFPIIITLSENASDFTDDDISVENGSISNFTGNGKNYTADVIPNSDGEVIIQVKEAVFTDDAANDNLASQQLSITSDLTPPTVAISTNVGTATMTSTFQITIVFSEDVSDFTIDDIAVGNGTPSNFTGSGDTYTADITASVEGEVTIDVAANVATDAVGNNNTAATQFGVDFDQTAPTLSISTDEPSLTNAASFTLTIAFSEDVIDFTADDITVGNGTASNFAGSGATYTADITPAADGIVTVDVAADIATDAAGNNNLAATQLSITSDQTAPTVTIATNQASPTNAAAFAVTVTFSEGIIDFTADDISVGNGTASNFAGTGTTYTVDITPAADGVVTVDVAADIATDAAGNNNLAATQLSITSDQTAPTVTLSTESNLPTEGAFTVSVIFSESVAGFTEEDIELTNGTISNFNAVNSSTYSFKVISDQNTATLSIAGSKASDVSGNGNLASESILLTFNNSPEDILLDTNSIAENSGADASVGNFTTQDADEADTHIYTLISGDGDTDNTSFKITGNSLIAVVDFDFETQDSYSIRVNSEDSFGSSISKTFTITVTNVGEAILRISGDQMAPNTGIGLSSTFEISLHNDGDGSLTVSSILYPEGFTGPTSDITLAPAESENITVSFSPTERKTYNGDMVITSNGGSINLALTGIGELITSTEEDLPASELSVYPNPANSYISLDLSAYNGTPLTVTLYDLNGTQRTSIQDYIKPSIRIDVSHYPNGIYLVGVSDGKFTSTKKVMIRR